MAEQPSTRQVGDNDRGNVIALGLTEGRDSGVQQRVLQAGDDEVGY